VHDQGSLGKCKVGAPHSHKGLRANRGELIGGVWFGWMGKVTSGWFVVYVGDGVEDRYVVVHDKANG
jgi:hypothetical protein